jgi:hypothetical protein
MAARLSRSLVAAAALAGAAVVVALENGMALQPSMGINTWYMLHSHLTNYIWQPGYCASCEALAIATWMHARGFHDLGYTWVNFDDW